MEEMEEASTWETNQEDIMVDLKKKKKKGRNGKRPGVSKEQRGIWIWLESQAVFPLQGSHAKDAEG